MKKETGKLSQNRLSIEINLNHWHIPQGRFIHYLQKILDISISNAIYLLSDKNFGRCDASKTRITLKQHLWAWQFYCTLKVLEIHVYQKGNTQIVSSCCEYEL